MDQTQERTVVSLAVPVFEYLNWDEQEQRKKDVITRIETLAKTSRNKESFLEGVKRLVENTKIGMYYSTISDSNSDSDEIIVTYNDKACDIFGFNRDDIQGKSRRYLHSRIATECEAENGETYLWVIRQSYELFPDKEERIGRALKHKNGKPYYREIFINNVNFKGELCGRVIAILIEEISDREYQRLLRAQNSFALEGWSQNLHLAGSAGLSRVEEDNQTQGPRVEEQPEQKGDKADPLARAYKIFADLSLEQKREFLNVVAWAKPVEVMQAQEAGNPQIADALESSASSNPQVSWVKKFNGAEAQSKTDGIESSITEFPENASALEIMQRAYNVFVQAALRVSRINAYDLIICNNIKNDLGDVIIKNLKRICGAKEEDKLTIVRGTTSYVSRTTSEKPKFPTAFIKIEKKDGGSENRKIIHQDKKEIQVIN